MGSESPATPRARHRNLSVGYRVFDSFRALAAIHAPRIGDYHGLPRKSLLSRRFI